MSTLEADIQRVLMGYLNSYKLSLLYCRDYLLGFSHREGGFYVDGDVC